MKNKKKRGTVSSQGAGGQDGSSENTQLNEDAEEDDKGLNQEGKKSNDQKDKSSKKSIKNKKKASRFGFLKKLSCSKKCRNVVKKICFFKELSTFEIINFLMIICSYINLGLKYSYDGIMDTLVE